MSEINSQTPDMGAVEVHGINRASFILRGALATGAAMGLGAVTPFVTNALAATASSDIDILNFALTLEYLETAFYQEKAPTLPLTGEAKTLAAEFGDQEAEHVSALIAAIKGGGGTPVAKPTFGFPVTDQTGFLQLAYALENTGVSAYNGAGPSLKDKALLGAAGSIVQVEARHAAAIALLGGGPSPVPNGGFDKPLTKTQVLAAASKIVKIS